MDTLSFELDEYDPIINMYNKIINKTKRNGKSMPECQNSIHLL